MNELIKKRMLRIPVMFIVTVFFSACASSQVQPVYDTSVKFNLYKSYSWHAGKENDKYHAKNPLVHAAIKLEIDNSLKASAHVNVQRGNQAEFLVDYQMSIEAKQSTSSSSISFGTGSYGRGSSVGIGIAVPLGGGRTENEITLIVQIIDTRTNKIIWRAVGVETVSGSTTGSSIVPIMGDLARKIIIKFPPKK